MSATADVGPRDAGEVRVRTLRPAPGVYGFYAGRVPGERFAATPNWVDPFALDLGICSYAIVDGDEALVYDTLVSVAHAARIRAVLAAAGVRRITVVLSHWHLDHVAGTAAFPGCEVVAGARTAAHLARRRAAIEAGTLEGPPAIDPLVLPTRIVTDGTTLTVGRRAVRLVAADVHSDDATLLWLEDARILFAGDTMEDTVPFVDEPDRIDVQLAELARLATLRPAAILPSHGDPRTIARGGYPPALIPATQAYLEVLRRAGSEPALREVPLRDLVAADCAAGTLAYHAPYEAVHAENLEAVARLAAAAPTR